jgi:predicted oxidoreductase
MWHYCEGLRNWAPIWSNHGIRILPGPSSVWLDAMGQRMEAPFFPGFDTLGTLKRILSTGLAHSWFILTQSVIEKEFALSGSEQNPDLTEGGWLAVLRERLGKGATRAVEAFKDRGEDFVVARDLEALVAGMNRITPESRLDPARIRAQIEARDAAIDGGAQDAQVAAIRAARGYLGDKLIRTAKPHRILDPAHGPLIAVRLNILTRKSLGGLHTDLSARVLRPDGTVFDGLYAVGEAAGFGGGGYHGYNALEGTFLGGCIFSGKVAGGAV